MTSLKAISTSRKRTKRFLLSIILSSLLLMPLMAGEYRIGLVLDGETGPVSTLITDAMTFSSSTVGNGNLVISNEERVAREEKLRKETEKGKAIRSEKKYEEKQEKPDDTPLVGRIVNLEPDPVTLKYLSAGDKDAISYLKLVEKLDEVVYVSSSLENGLYEISVSIDGEEKAFILYSELLGGLEKNLLPVFLEHYRGERYHLVGIDGNVGANITENGENVEKFSSFLVLSEGQHELLFTQTGYLSLSLLVDVDENLEKLSYNLEKEKGSRLFISSSPYPEKLFFNGKPVDSMSVEEADLPFTVTATKEGYVPRTVQSAREREYIELQLLPVTFYDKDKLEEEKKSFYTHLLSTLLSFGVSVASETLDRLTPDTDLSLVTAGLYGLTTTGVVMMVDSLFDYKNALSRSY